MADSARRFSPYAYGFDNPIRFIDPDGRWPYPWLIANTLYQTAKHKIQRGFGLVTAIEGAQDKARNVSQRQDPSYVENVPADVRKNIDRGRDFEANLKMAEGVTEFAGATLGAAGALLGGVEATLGSAVTQVAAKGVLTSFDNVASYVSKSGNLPSNYITKAQAKALGWNPKLGNLDAVAPGKSIGGDIFKNSEGLLPKASGRNWFEADINYSGGFRGNERLLYSNDGLIYKTTDHYKTFTPIR